MNSMKNPWVKDLTIFFENLGKTNLRASIKRKRESKYCKNKCYIVDKRFHITEEKNLQIFPQEVNTSVSSGMSEHCIKVKAAKDIFENRNSVFKNENMSYNSSPLKKQVSVYDIFSGTATDLDILPIEAEAEEDGVYQRAVDMCAVPDNAKTSIVAPSLSSHIYNDSADRLPIDKKKSVSKSPSYVERKNQFKKSSVNFKTVATESDVEKENDGVIIRMKNQESYYDGRAKYKSLLPEPPFYHLVDSKRGRRSLWTQKAVDKSIELNDSDLSNGHVNSIMLQDVPLPAVDGNHNVIDQICLEEDGNYSDELEPNGECDSTTDIKFPRLLTQGPQRIKWAETEEGKKLIRIKDLKVEMIRWQEAQFEVISSEASYYRSLQILVNKIYKNRLMVCKGERRPPSFSDDSPNHPEAVTTTTTATPTSPSPQYLMTPLQKHHLFSNILEIHICSEELLKALETRWRENPFIEDLSDILVSFSKEKLRPYITYIRNQQYQTATYNELLTKPEFLSVMKTIEKDNDLGMMDLSSFLLLPMQRLLRLKLLFNAVKHNTPSGYPTQGCDAAIQSLEALIKECSDQKMLMEQKEEILKIYNRLTFRNIKGVSIGNKPLLKDGQLRVSASNSKASKSLHSGFINRNNNTAQLYLFEDQLIIAKTRKLPLCFSSTDDREMVVDVCPRSDIVFDTNIPNKPIFFAKNNIFRLTLSKGLKGSAEYMCEVESRDALAEWENVFTPDVNGCEHFEFNDALVIADHPASSDTELDIKQGQILRIIRRLDDHRAVATAGDRQGVVPLACVRVNTGLAQDMWDCCGQNKVN